MKIDTITDLEFVHETEKAVLVKDSAGKETWVPRSVIHERRNLFKKGDKSGELVIDAWFSEKKFQ